MNQLIKAIFCLFFVIAFQVPALANGQSDELQDVSYQFDSAKLVAVQDSFQFLKSFVDLFYLSFKKNELKLSSFFQLSNVRGWCVGDAHIENFGVLLQENQSPLFTMNDMDDSGPCPIGLDLFRLMVSSRLFDANTKLEKIVQAYVLGVQNQHYDKPNTIQEMLDKGAKKGIIPSDKKIQNNKIIRDEQSKELTKQEVDEINQALKIYTPDLSADAKILDMVATSKIGGGSGGILRYEILLENGSKLLHLELKEQVQASIYPVAPSIPPTDKRIEDTLSVSQGPGASKLYKVLKLNGKDFLGRPRFAGNISTSFDRQKKDEGQEVIRYEAYTLGLIHSRSIKNPGDWRKLVDSISDKDWENEVSLMTDYFEKKYKEVSANIY